MTTQALTTSLYASFDAIRHTLEKQGLALCRNTSLFDTVIVRTLTQHRLERNILCIALRENAPLILANAVNPDIASQRLIRILVSDYGICQKQAEWAIETWRILVSNLPEPAITTAQHLQSSPSLTSLMPPTPELTMLTPTDIYLERVDWRAKTEIVVSLLNSGQAPLCGDAKILRGQNWSTLSSQAIPVCLPGQQFNLSLTLNPHQMVEGHSSTLIRLMTTGGISNIYVRACKESASVLNRVMNWLSPEKAVPAQLSTPPRLQIASAQSSGVKTQQFAASKTATIVLRPESRRTSSDKTATMTSIRTNKGR